MQIYCYNKAGQYLGSMKAQIEPVENKLILPDNATSSPPPKCDIGEIAVFNGEIWTKVIIPQPVEQEGLNNIWTGESWVSEKVEKPVVADGQKLFWADGQWLETHKTAAELTAEQEITTKIEIERKISLKKRELAVDALIADGELSSDFKEKDEYLSLLKPDEGGSTKQ